MSLINPIKATSYKNDMILTYYLVKYQTHIGNKKAFRKDQLDELIYGINRSSTSIFDIEKTLSLLRRTLNFVSLISKRKGLILFVGTRSDISGLTKNIGEKTSNPYVHIRWIRGLITNWENISTSIKFFKLYQSKLNLSKKRSLKLKNTFEGLQNLKKLPDAIFLIDPLFDNDVIHEAKRLNIPLIGIVDNNLKTDLIDYPIVGNTNSILSLLFFTQLIVKAILDNS